MILDVHFLCPAALLPTPARPAAGRPARGSINQRLLEALERDADRATWSLRRWAGWLSCSISGVRRTSAWRRILKLRGMHQQEGAERLRRAG